MGSGSSSQEGEHAYEEIRSIGQFLLTLLAALAINQTVIQCCVFRVNRTPKRNCSMITLDIRPEQWRELCREEARSREGRGEWKMMKEGFGELGKEERYRYSGGWEGCWEEDSRSRSSSSGSSIKRCVSMDIKQLDSFDLKGSSASF